jgi:vancomycin permeability regulator SanA
MMKNFVQTIGKYGMKLLLWAVSSVLFFGLLAFVFAVMQWGRVVSYTGEIFEGTAECGVIFGAAVWRDDIPSHALADRIIAGGELYLNEQVTCLVLSGGPSKIGAHEVDVMKKELLEMGVAEEDLVLDYYGLTTRHTVQNVVRLVGKEKSVVFVSHDFHLARIALLAKRFGFENYGVHGASEKEGQLMNLTYYRLREVGGNMLYFFYFPR